MLIWLINKFMRQLLPAHFFTEKRGKACKGTTNIWNTQINVCFCRKKINLRILIKVRLYFRGNAKRGYWGGLAGG